jgi:hypothetical protein
MDRKIVGQVDRGSDMRGFLRLSILFLCTLVSACVGDDAGKNSTTATKTTTATGAAADPIFTTPQRLFVDVTQTTPTAVSLQWTGGSSPDVTDFRILRNGQQVMLAEDIQRRFRDMDLAPNTSYSYEVQALDANGRKLVVGKVKASTVSGAANLTAADVPPSDVVRGRSLTTFGWTPNPLYDTCSKALHDSFWTFGPDNKAYPTWHPPVYEFADGSTCRFGHEHGHDPHESVLYATVGAFPLGYVNEQVSPGDPTFQRNEDHVGHKIELANNLPSGNSSGSGPTCNVLNKFHMGTHGADAFANNTHEIMINLDCANGLAVRWKSLHALGSPGTFDEAYYDPAVNNFAHRQITSGRTPTPGQPTWGEHRIIHTLKAVQDSGILNNLLYNGEAWVAAIGAYTNDAANNRVAFGATLYWRTQNVSRLYDPSATNNNLVKRWIDLCYDSTSASYTTDFCVTARSRNGGQPIPWDSPLSPFRGSTRAVDFNSDINIVNTTGKPYWYFHPYTFDFAGQVPRPVATRSATYPIRQYIARTPTTAPLVISHPFNFSGPNQTYNGIPFHDFANFKLKNGQTVDSGVHAPN